MQCRKNLDILEKLTKPLWGEYAKCNDCKQVFDLIGLIKIVFAIRYAT